MKQYQNYKIHVLIVEDDEYSQLLMTGYLGDRYNLHFSSTVSEAEQQLIKYSQIDLILLDLSLRGDENGLQLVKKLRQSDRWKSLPVIVVTAHAFEIDKKYCLQQGCNGFLKKPIRKAKLLEEMSRFIPVNQDSEVGKKSDILTISEKVN